MSTGDRISTLALATAALAAVSGCGGSAATSTSTTASTPTAQVVSTSASPASEAPGTSASTPAKTAGAAPTTGGFRSQAAAVCRHQNEMVLSMLLGGAKRRRWVTPAAATREAERELAAVTPPSALSGAWTQVRSERAIVAKDLLSPGGAGTPQAAAAAAERRQAQTSLRTAAAAAGVQGCASIG